MELNACRHRQQISRIALTTQIQAALGPSRCPQIEKTSPTDGASLAENKETLGRTQATAKWLIGVFEQMWFVLELPECGAKLKRSSPWESALATTCSFTLNYTRTHAHTRTHTCTWSDAASRLVGWLTLACRWVECAPITAGLLQPLVNPHCMKQPSGSPSSTLTGLSFPNLSLSLSTIICVRACVCVRARLHSCKLTQWETKQDLNQHSEGILSGPHRAGHWLQRVKVWVLPRSSNCEFWVGSKGCVNASCQSGS